MEKNAVHHPSRVIFRELVPSDTEAFLNLKRIGLSANPEDFVASLPDDPLDYPQQVSERIKKASVESGDIIVGAFAPDLVGIISVTRDKRLKRRHKADLHGMFVIPEFRGRGIGKRLFLESMDLAYKMPGLEEIQLIVASGNSGAYTMYQQFGFEPVWREKHALKVDSGYVDAYHMVLRLDVASFV